jgi:DNA-binding NarL/FixJ family response regulator
MKARPVRIVLVEDQPLVRAGVRKVLEAELEFEVVGEAGDGEEMMKLLRSRIADLVVLDLNMPKRDGFEAMRDLQALDPPVKVLVLSLHDDPLYVGRAVREGAHGYLLKDSAVDDLPTAVRTVMAGGPFFSSRAQAALTDAMRKGGHMSPLELLTARELEVLKRVAAGLSSKEIGAALNISARTIESHRASLMRKLDLHSVAELTRFALEQGLIGTP